MTEAEKIKKLTKNFLCLNEDGKRTRQRWRKRLPKLLQRLYRTILPMEGQTLPHPGKRARRGKVENKKMNAFL